MQQPATIPPNPGLGFKLNFVVNRSRALLSDYMNGWRMGRKKREVTSDTVAEEITIVALVSLSYIYIQGVPSGLRIGLG